MSAITEAREAILRSAEAAERMVATGLVPDGAEALYRDAQKLEEAMAELLDLPLPVLELMSTEPKAENRLRAATEIINETARRMEAWLVASELVDDDTEGGSGDDV